MIGLSMATMGALAALAQFWSLPVAFLGSAPQRAVGAD
jgi:hypothetical protein